MLCCQGKSVQLAWVHGGPSVEGSGAGGGMSAVQVKCVNSDSVLTPGKHQLLEQMTAISSGNSHKPHHGLMSEALKKSVLYKWYNRFKNGQELPEDKYSSSPATTKMLAQSRH
jgi:hypothetical protein